MDKKKLMLGLVAIVLAIGTALLVRNMFLSAATPQATAAQVPQGPKVLVAQRALPVGTIITADSVSFQAWPKEMVQDAYFLEGEADMTKMLGTVVRNPITAGQPITQGSLVAPGDRGFLAAALGPGMRAVTITVSQKTGVAGFIFPGDHVDLLLTSAVKGNDSNPQALQTTETILRNLRVLATDQATNTDVVDGHSVVRASKTVTVEVTPRIAEKIQVAEMLGTLSLSLRSLADNQADLEKALANGTVKIPTGASKLDEDRLLTEAMNRPIEGATDFVTGGDVSRFARRTIPVMTPVVPVAAGGPAGGAPHANLIERPRGPIVHVTNGQNTVDVMVGR